MRKKKYQHMLLKNTLAVAVPAIAVFLVLIFLCSKYPVFEHISCYQIKEDADVDATLSTHYAEHTNNVKIQPKQLKYTGLDYYEDGKIKGAYYYMSTENKLIFFLLKTDKPDDVITSREIKGVIIKDDVSKTYITGQFADYAGIDEASLSNYCSDYIISEVGYPYMFITMVYALFLAPIIISIIILLYTFYIWLNPEAHPQSKQLAVYGDVNIIIDEINSQLKNQLLFKKNNIYITEDYIIINYISKTDVIKLSAVKYISKNIIEVSRKFGKPYEIYRLTASDPDKLFYEIDFSSEEILDDIISYINNSKKESSHK